MATTRKINISEVVENSKMGAFHTVVGILCGLCVMIDGFDVQALGYAAPALIKDWKIAGSALGPVFSAALFGVLIGSLAFSVVADKIGRRPMLIVATLFFSIMTFWAGRVNTINELLLVRFIAGMGLGGIMPNALALMGEYTPSRSRASMTVIIANAFNIGAMLGGFVAAWLIPSFGWRSVFYFGGAIPLAIAILMIFFLPESLQLMVLRGHDRNKISRWLKRVDAAAPTGNDVEYVAREEKKEGVPVIHLFSGGRAGVTVLLWVIFFLNLLNLYLLASWLPTVVSASGYSTGTAVMVGTTLQAGGSIAGFALAVIIGRFGLVPSLAVGFGAAAVCIGMIGQPGIPLAALLAVVFIAGWGVPGGQNLLNALATSYYPTYLRSTGVGWCLGIGRMGAVVGPLFAGEMMRRHLPNQQLFMVAGSLAVIATVAIICLRFLMKPQQEISAAKQVLVH
jgi:AAHS family 4-hydroxybenzoate transporter-like MFS transporter